MPRWVWFLLELIMGKRPSFSLIVFSLEIIYTDTEISLYAYIIYRGVCVCLCVSLSIEWSSVLVKAQL